MKSVKISDETVALAGTKTSRQIEIVVEDLIDKGICEESEPCSECGVPTHMSKIHDEYDFDSDHCLVVRLEMGRLVGELGMENWLNCRSCQEWK